MLNRNVYIFTVTFLIYFTVTTCSAYRILGVFPTPTKSHYFLGNAVMKALAKAGHDVTIIAPYPEENPPKNGSWREILLTGHEHFSKEATRNHNITQNSFSINPFTLFNILKTMTVGLTEYTMQDPAIQKLINSGEKFDVVIVTEFMTDALKVFANVFDAHLVAFSNAPTINWYYSNIGQFVPPSCYPETLTNFPPTMNFFQRLSNSVLHVILKIAQSYLIYPDHQALLDKYFPAKPKLQDLMQNVSLVLVNTHISLHNAQPKVPAMIEIGGIHIKPPKKLPDDLQKLLDNAKNGVIYFSMGSHINPTDLPLEKLNNIMKAFAKRKETILWKHSEDTLIGKPDNVYVRKWFPQQDILAHPNVKLFVTHSGFLSTTETIYHGVPLVGIPILGDQKLNAISASYAGYGKVVFVEDLTEDTLGQAIEEVVSDPKFRENVKERSRLFHDRQTTPTQDAVYWIEYVVRHNGAKHLRVPYLELNWYEYYLVDVILFITTILFIVLYIAKKLIGFLIRKIFARRSKEKTA